MKGFDFSGLDRFLEVARLLQSGKEPPEDTWKALFQTPGYGALTQREFTPETFQEVWRLAFSPGARSDQSQVSPGRRRLGLHARQAGENRDLLLRAREDLERNQARIMSGAREKACLYLPQGDYVDWSGVSFLVFDRDARGYQPVVVDLSYAVDLMESAQLVNLLAHEFHHQQVARIRGTGLGTAADDRSDLEWVVDQIHLEGVADLITVPGLLSPDQLKTYMAQVREAPRFLAEMDRLLARDGGQGSPAPDIGAVLRQELPLSGHPVGYYMARDILGQLGIDRVREAAACPGLFFELFRRAEKLAGREPLLSPETVALVKDLARTRADA